MSKLKDEYAEWLKTNPEGSEMDFAIWKAGQMLRKVT